MNRTSFHFYRVFKQTTGQVRCNSSPADGITRAQQMMRAITDAQQRPGFQSKRSLIEIALEVGYTSPSAFAQVFRHGKSGSAREFCSIRASADCS